MEHCNEQAVVGYAQGLLRGTARRELQAHLVGCRSCSNTLAGARHVAGGPGLSAAGSLAERTVNAVRRLFDRESDERLS